eukprot:SAG31_NODE_170_length_21415_cov_8.230813_5_plen_138_part_00
MGAVQDNFASSTRLTHFRLVMGSCVAPCIVGFFVLLLAAFGFCGQHRLRKSSSTIVGMEMQRLHRQDAQQSRVEVDSISIAAVAIGLVAQGAAASLFSTAWPLFVNTHFGWTDIEFAPVTDRRYFLHLLTCGTAISR